MAREPPYACCAVVWREGPGGREFLVLHRAHRGPEYARDWAWTPPSGARQPGEEPEAAAARELREEAGLELSLAPVESPHRDVALFVAKARADAEVALDAEHDALSLASFEVAAELRLPARVADSLRAAAAVLK